jgi:hypothetical protein
VVVPVVELCEAVAGKGFLNYTPTTILFLAVLISVPKSEEDDLWEDNLRPAYLIISGIPRQRKYNLRCHITPSNSLVLLASSRIRI